MPGTTTRTKTRSRDSIGFNKIKTLIFDSIASVPISQVPATVQGAFMLPCACKVMGAAAYYTTIGSTSGSFGFNIVAGTGTYETTAGGRGIVNITMGTPHTGDLVTITFQVPNALMLANGVPTTYEGILGQIASPSKLPLVFQYQVKATDTTATALATSITQAFNSSQFNSVQAHTVINNILFAWNVAGAIVSFSGLQANVLLNSINVASKVTGAGATTTATVGTATITGASSPTGVVPGVNAQFEYTGRNSGTTNLVGTYTNLDVAQYGYNFAPAGSGTLAATPVFSADMPLFTPVVGNSVYWPTNFDVIYQQGTIMTLRLITPTAAPLTNIKIKLLISPFDVAPPNPTFRTFDPHNDIY